MERVIEIVNLVMKQVLYQGNQEFSEKQLIDNLVGLGYRTDEIELAFKFLHSISDSLRSDPEFLGYMSRIRQGQRVFSPDEQKRLSLSFQGEFLRLTSYQLLTPEEAEKVLFEAMQIESGEVGLKELDLILHKVIKDEERLMMINPQSNSKSPTIFIN